MNTNNESQLGGQFTFPGTPLTVNRLGYGAMQLAGPHVFGPPANREEALAVLRQAVAAGVNHIDTSDFYGPHVTNQIIKEALHPYPTSLCLVTKVGARRDAQGGWPKALSAAELRQAVLDNLENLGLDSLDIVNLRVGAIDRPEAGSLAEPFTVLAEMQSEGLIKHLGVSTVMLEQVLEAQSIAPVVFIILLLSKEDKDKLSVASYIFQVLKLEICNHIFVPPSLAKTSLN